MSQLKRLIIRPIAAALIIAFIAQDIAWAHPDGFTLHHSGKDKLAAPSFFKDEGSPARLYGKLIEYILEEKYENIIPRDKLDISVIRHILKKHEKEDWFVKNIGYTFSEDEVLISVAPGYSIRYFDPGVKGNAGKYANKVEKSVELNNRLSKQVLVVKALPHGRISTEQGSGSKKPWQHEIDETSIIPGYTKLVTPYCDKSLQEFYNKNKNGRSQVKIEDPYLHGIWVPLYERGSNRVFFVHIENGQQGKEVKDDYFVLDLDAKSPGKQLSYYNNKRARPVTVRIPSVPRPDRKLNSSVAIGLFNSAISGAELIFYYHNQLEAMPGRWSGWMLDPDIADADKLKAIAELFFGPFYVKPETRYFERHKQSARVCDAVVFDRRNEYGLIAELGPHSVLGLSRKFVNALRMWVDFGHQVFDKIDKLPQVCVLYSSGIREGSIPSTEYLIDATQDMAIRSAVERCKNISTTGIARTIKAVSMAQGVINGIVESYERRAGKFALPKRIIFIIRNAIPAKANHGQKVSVKLDFRKNRFGRYELFKQGLDVLPKPQNTSQLLTTEGFTLSAIEGSSPMLKDVLHKRLVEFEKKAIKILRADESRLGDLNQEAEQSFDMTIVPAFSADTIDLYEDKDTLKVASAAWDEAAKLFTQICSKTGWPISDIKNAAYELSHNAQKRGDGGIVTLRTIRKDGQIVGIEIVARDIGKGIGDPEANRKKSIKSSRGTTPTGARGGGLTAITNSIFAREGEIEFETGDEVRARRFVYDPSKEEFVEKEASGDIKVGTRARLTLIKKEENFISDLHRDETGAVLPNKAFWGATITALAVLGLGLTGWYSFIWNGYLSLLSTYPLTINIVTAFILALFGDFAAQKIEQSKLPPEKREINFKRLVYFPSIIAFLYGLMFSGWLKLLDYLGEGLYANGLKVLLQAFIFSPVYYIIFFPTIEACKHWSLHNVFSRELLKEMWRNFKSTYKRDLIFWGCFVNPINFIAAPYALVSFNIDASLINNFRVLIGNVADLFWDTYLSWVAHRREFKETKRYPLIPIEAGIVDGQFLNERRVALLDTFSNFTDFAKEWFGADRKLTIADLYAGSSDFVLEMRKTYPELIDGYASVDRKEGKGMIRADVHEFAKEEENQGRFDIVFMLAPVKHEWAGEMHRAWNSAFHLVKKDGVVLLRLAESDEPYVEKYLDFIKKSGHFIVTKKEDFEGIAPTSGTRGNNTVYIVIRRPVNVPQYYRQAYLAIPDLHGAWEAFENAVNYALKWSVKKMIFLGDIIDRGSAGIRIFDGVKDLVGQGKAVALWGNHEAAFVLAMLGNTQAFEHLTYSDNGGCTTLIEAGINIPHSGIDAENAKRIHDEMMNNPKLKEMAEWFIKNLKLYYLDEYGCSYVHATMPLRLHYSGKKGLKALDEIEKDIRGGPPDLRERLLYTMWTAKNSPINERNSLAEQNKEDFERTVSSLLDSGINGIVHGHRVLKFPSNVSNFIYNINSYEKISGPDRSIYFLVSSQEGVDIYNAEFQHHCRMVIPPVIALPERDEDDIASDTPESFAEQIGRINRDDYFEKGKGSLIEGLKAIEKYAVLRKGGFTMKQFKERRHYSGTTCYSEISGLSSVGILHTDKSKKPYKYVFSAGYTRAPPEFKREIRKLLEGLPARPDKALLEKTKHSITRILRESNKIEKLITEIENIGFSESDPDKICQELESIFTDKIVPLSGGARDRLLAKILSFINPIQANSKKQFNFIKVISLFFSPVYTDTHQLTISKSQYEYLWKIYGQFRYEDVCLILEALAITVTSDKVRIAGDPDKTYARRCAEKYFREFLTSRGKMISEWTYMSAAWKNFIKHTDKKFIDVALEHVIQGELSSVLSGMVVRDLLLPVCQDSKYVRDALSGMVVKEMDLYIKGDVNDVNAALDGLFSDEENARKFFKYASILRMIYPYELTKNDKRPPLRYALEEGVYFKIGDNLYMTPISESFRRHIVFSKNVSGEIKFAIEVMMPGDNPDRRDVGIEERSRVAKHIRREFPDKDYCVKVLFDKTFPSGDYDIYGQRINFSDAHCKLKVIGYEYKEDGKRLEFVSKQVLKDISGEIGMPLKEFERSIVEQVAELTAATHYLGYIGHSNSDESQQHINHDHHTGNFRISIVNGKPKIILVGDFGVFERQENVREPDREAMIDITNIVESLKDDYSLKKIISTLTVGDMYSIFEQVYKRFYPLESVMSPSAERLREALKGGAKKAYLKKGISGFKIRLAISLQLFNDAPNIDLMKKYAAQIGHILHLVPLRLGESAIALILDKLDRDVSSDNEKQMIIDALGYVKSAPQDANLQKLREWAAECLIKVKNFEAQINAIKTMPAEKRKEFIYKDLQQMIKGDLNSHFSALLAINIDSNVKRVIFHDFYTRSFQTIVGLLEDIAGSDSTEEFKEVDEILGILYEVKLYLEGLAEIKRIMCHFNFKGQAFLNIKESRKTGNSPEEILAGINELTVKGLATHPLKDGARVLLSENLFIRDGDRTKLEEVKLALKPVLDSGAIAIMTPRDLRREATNRNSAKNKLAVVLTNEDKDAWKGFDNDMSLKASVLIVDDKLSGSNYLYLQGVIGLANAIMSNDKQSINYYYQFLSGGYLDDVVLRMLDGEAENNIGFALKAILKFRPISEENKALKENLPRYKIMMENYLIQA